MGMTAKAIREYMSAPKAECRVLIEKLRQLEISSGSRFEEFFLSMKNVLLPRWDYAVMLEADPGLKQQTIEKLQDINHELYANLEPVQGYPKSLSNPDYSTKLYGEQLGKLLSVIFTPAFATHQRYLNNNFLELKTTLELYFRLYDLAGKGIDEYDTWLQAYREHTVKDQEMVIAFNYLQRFSPDEDYFRNIVLHADLGDNRYLYRYGSYISTHDQTMASYINSYPEAELKSLAAFIVKSFVDGFVRAKKDYRTKKYVNLVIPVGFERLGRMLMAELNQLGLVAMLPKPRNIEICRQHTYDHRFDVALIWDRQFVENSLKAAQNTLEMLLSLIHI